MKPVKPFEITLPCAVDCIPCAKNSECSEQRTTMSVVPAPEVLAYAVWSPTKGYLIGIEGEYKEKIEFKNFGESTFFFVEEKLKHILPKIIEVERKTTPDARVIRVGLVPIEEEVCQNQTSKT